MKTKARKKLDAIVSHSLFYSSLAFLLAGCIFVGLSKLLSLNENTYNVILPLNGILLLVCTVLSLFAIVRKQTALIVTSIGMMLTLLFLSSPFLSNSSITSFNMPWLQLLSWLLLILGLIGKFKQNNSFWNRLSVVSFTFLLLLVVSLLLADNGTLWGIKFGFSPSASLNTAIFLFFSATAGLTVSSAIIINSNIRNFSLGRWLALLITVSSISLWLNFMAQLEAINQQVAKETVLKLQQQTKQILESQSGLMQRLGDRLSANKSVYQPEQLSLDFSTYLRDFNYLDYIAVLNMTGSVHYSSAQSPKIKEWYDTYLVSEYAQLSNQLNSENNLNVSFYYNEQIDKTFFKVKIPQPNALDVSEVIASINFRKIMQSSIPLIVPYSYAITLSYENQPNLLISQIDERKQYFKIGEYIVKNPSGISWQLSLYRDFDIELNYARQISEIILISGWLACLLALLTQQYQSKMQWQQRRLLMGNKRLRNSLMLQKKLKTDHLQFMENSADLLWIIDAEGKFIELSNSSSWVLGYSAEELEGRMFMEFVHPDDHEITEREAEKIILKGQHTHYFRNRYIGKDGNVVHLMWSSRYVPSIKTMYAVGRDITVLVKAERYQDAQQNILELISAEQPLDEILKQICLMAEEYNPDIKACVMLKVEDQLQIVSAPSLSKEYHLALTDVPISGVAGSCGTAAFQKKLVIVENVATDPKWSNYADIVLAENLTACWSMPMLSNEDNVLGTFALYCGSARSPVTEELELLASCCRFAANAIDRSQQKRLLSESEQRFRSLYQFNPDVVYALDHQGYFEDVNTAGCDLLGWSLSELKQMHFSEIVPSEQLTQVTGYFVSALSGEAESFETGLLDRNATRHELQITIIPTWINGKIAGVIGIAKDITQRLQIEKQLRLFKRAVDANSNGVVIADITQPNMPMVYVNHGFERLTGYSQSEALGKNCRFLQGNDRDELAISKIRFAIESKEEVSVVLRNYRKDGSSFWNNLFLSPVPNDIGVITHFIGIQTDITEQKKHEHELAFNASHDLLTGLPNRSLLQNRLTQSMKMRARNKSEIAILFIDLDGFKSINDGLGHSFGDEVLRQVSARINSQIRPGDTLARMGGDEFILLIPDFTEVNQLNAMVERLLTNISTPLEISGREVQITASIGISISSADINEPMELVKQADLAMYQAKKLGRNNAQWYIPDMEKALNKRLTLKVMLKQAIINKELELYYQPQIEAGSGQLIGLEALLRWKHPELGFISPDEFIPIAEETGLIIEIGQWVIEQAATYNRSLQERGLVHLIMAVNLSSIQFQRSEFVEQLEKILYQSKLEPKWFELELTESLLLENFEQVVQKLQKLKRLGIHIAIDDFGTGYSSLNYLKVLPIDKLKIDKSFIRELVIDQKDAAITRAIIAMAHELDLKVIAEGVETLPQAILLYENSCDALQGYYFSKPLPTDELELFLKHYSPVANSGAL